jgi:hypothetical protein
MNTTDVDRSRNLWVSILAFALWGALLGAVFVRHYVPNEFATYLIQLIATFIGAALAVAFGIALFNYQNKQTDQRRIWQLNEALAAELQATLDILEAPPGIRVSPPTGVEEEDEEPVEVVVTRLEPVACEEAIRNAILGPQDVFALSHLARSMRLYNVFCARLESVMCGPSFGNPQLVYFDAAKDVKGQQDNVINWCKVNVESFSEEGIDVPARHFSKNTHAQSGELTASPIPSEQEQAQE